jgi:hypothetical protein
MLVQLTIALFGLTAVYLGMVSTSVRANRWAPVVGLMGQPFWLYATGSAAQWGMFGLCLAYTVVYAIGVWRWWGEDLRLWFWMCVAAVNDALEGR